MLVFLWFSLKIRWWHITEIDVFLDFQVTLIWFVSLFWLRAISHLPDLCLIHWIHQNFVVQKKIKIHYWTGRYRVVAQSSAKKFCSGRKQKTGLSGELAQQVTKLKSEP